jgi:large subunit ribosomal protein L9
MKVLLIKDVFKLGRAGEVKKVADGYGRNYLIPQELAVLATPGALKQAEHIRERANAKRAILNQEMSSIADMLSDLSLTFSAKAGETDKLYGSITSQMIVDEIQEKLGVEINRRQVDHEPIRTVGTHSVRIRLTMDLIPEITVIVFRDGDSVGEVDATEEAAEAVEEASASVESIEEETAAPVDAEDLIEGIELEESSEHAEEVEEIDESSASVSEEAVETEAEAEE